MRVARSGRAATLATVLTIIAFAGPAAATTARPVTLTLIQNADTYENLGWSSSGPAFVDAGDWTVDRLVLGSPRTLLFGGVETTLTGASGTFRIDFHGGTTPVGSVAAPWRLYGGTGSYHHLVGNGSWTQIFLPPVPATNTPALLIFTLVGAVQ